MDNISNKFISETETKNQYNNFSHWYLENVKSIYINSDNYSRDIVVENLNYTIFTGIMYDYIEDKHIYIDQYPLYEKYYSNISKQCDQVFYFRVHIWSFVPINKSINIELYIYNSNEDLMLKTEVVNCSIKEDRYVFEIEYKWKYSYFKTKPQHFNLIIRDI